MRRTLSLFALVAVASVVGGAVGASHQFSDVPSSNPFHDDIAWLADNGIAAGFADGTFRPGEPVTRQALAAYLHRLSGEGSTPRSVDAAELADRPASDFDDAVTLAGRTPADYDNAVEVQGNTPEELQPNVYHAASVGEIIFDASTPSGADTIVTIPSVPAGTYVVDVSGVYRTTWEESVVSCFVGGTGTVLRAPHSLERVHAGTEQNLSDWGQLSGTAIVDLAVAGTISLRCHWQGLSGVDGDLIARNSSLIATAVEDL
jgi:hypothetical protein